MQTGVYTQNPVNERNGDITTATRWDNFRAAAKPGRNEAQAGQGIPNAKQVC
jgi:hypothetical protein